VSERERLRATVRGAVQGVGFRPFVYRLARTLALDGWVLNSPQGVFVEVEGEAPRLEEFLVRLERERPARAVIQSMESSWLDPVHYSGFEIRESTTGGERVTLVMSDIATCADCLRELLDPADRRHRYPFTNCTNCGPRFSIIESLPYDRGNTSMRAFEMCSRCLQEYHDPLDRRFHAQPNACPVCGPQLTLWDGTGRVRAERDEALHAAVAAVRNGRIVAVKGLGGFHLVVDARDAAAVTRLRERKHRDAKPLAVMYPTLDDVRRACRVSEAEARLLGSPECPIVLLERLDRHDASVAPGVAPGNPSLGVMLPYTPLHHLFLRELASPMIATSANLSDEPICTDEREALVRLAGIADVFLVHDRPIVRHVDDSVARIVAGRELVLRRARGFAPLPVPAATSLPPALAVGGHLKNTVAVSAGPNVFVSQHIGDLETSQSAAAFRRAVDDLERLYEVSPACVAADLHPDYLSTKFARGLGLPLVRVQHHHAHVLACMAENELEGPALGVSWDGTGYGPDGTVWGGEFLDVDGAAFTRLACLRPFRLPGGERAVKDPCRTALGLLHAMTGSVFGAADLAAGRVFNTTELHLLQRMLDRGLNAPVTTSAGRLFDAVAALTGIRQRTSFEAQAAMELEFAIDERVADAWACPLVDDPKRFAMGTWDVPRWVGDWAPLVSDVVEAVRQGDPVGAIAARFHNTLADFIVAVALRADRPNVILSGGCFQNRHLAEAAIARLREAGFRPYWHQRVPPNDGGLALGQLAFVARRASAAAREPALAFGRLLPVGGE
jgi:hydrogenase maturation protein HypF